MRKKIKIIYTERTVKNIKVQILKLPNRINNEIKHQSDRPVPLVARNDFLVEKVKTINTNNIFNKPHFQHALICIDVL